MQDYTPEETKKRFDALPSEIKGLLYSPEMTFIMQQVGQKNALHIDQIDTLNNETGQVMLGFVTTDEYVHNLSDLLSVDNAHAQKIAQDVSEMLFTKIRESMKKVYEQNTQAPAAATPKNPPAVEMGKSVVMPSSANIPPKPVVSAPVQATAPAAPAVSVMPTAPVSIAPKPVMPAKPVEMHPADVMLTEKTVQVAPAAQNSAPAATSAAVPPAPAAKPEDTKPVAYKADPYREPPE